MRDKRRFTGLAALGNRGEEGRIGFYQKPLTGQARRRILKVARVLERHDPRYGDKKTEFQSLVGEILAGGEALAHAGERALPHFFGEDEGGILLRITRMAVQRQPGPGRCSDMPPTTNL